MENSTEPTKQEQQETAESPQGQPPGLELLLPTNIEDQHLTLPEQQQQPQTPHTQPSVVVEIPGVAGGNLPSVPLWQYQDKSKVYRPFGPIDSRALEAARTKLKAGTLSEEDATFYVLQKTYKVNMFSRKMKAVFWDETLCNVQRVTWSYAPSVVSGKADKIPFSEEDADIIEDAFQRKITNEPIPLTDPTQFVAFYVEQPGKAKGLFAIIPSLNGAYYYTKGQISPPLSVYRRVDEFSEDDFAFDETLNKVPEHVIFVVHGIGEAFHPGENAYTIIDATKTIRQLNDEMLRMHFHKKIDPNLIPIVRYIPIEWHMVVHDEIITKQLQNIRLSTVPLIRDLAQDIISDVLFYLTPVHRKRILEQVVSQVNSLYASFKDVYPTSSSKASLLSHSLGSVISFDVLSHQPGGNALTTTFASDPEFPVFAPSFENLFAIGSPIGLFAVIKGGMGLQLNSSLPTTRSFFNIFHPHDPIAYRIEPIIDPRAVSLNPEEVPSHLGYVSLHRRLYENTQYVMDKIVQASTVASNVTSKVSSLFGFVSSYVGIGSVPTTEPENPSNSQPATPRVSESGSFPNTNSFKINNGRRVDYKLQESSPEYYVEYVAAVASHSSYWTSHDLVLFVLRELLGPEFKSS